MAMTSPSSVANLILETHDASATLSVATDALMATEHLQAARWRLLQTVARSADPLTVPYIARKIRLSRQAVQRLVDELVGRGVVVLKPNEHHATAQLVVLTKDGRDLYDRAHRRQHAFSEWLSGQFTDEEVRTTTQVMSKLRSVVAGLDSDMLTEGKFS